MRLNKRSDEAAGEPDFTTEDTEDTELLFALAKRCPVAARGRLPNQGW